MTPYDTPTYNNMDMIIGSTEGAKYISNGTFGVCRQPSSFYILPSLTAPELV